MASMRAISSFSRPPKKLNVATLGLGPVQRLQSGQSLIDGDHVLQRNGRPRLRKLVHLENLDLSIPPAPFPRLFGAREIHQDLAHEARCGGKELAPVLPLTASTAH